MALRALGWFWASVIGLLAIGGIVLQVLGPPAPKMARVVPAPKPVTPSLPSAPPPPIRSSVPGRAVPAGWNGQVAAPDPALLEAAPGEAAAMLPRISAAGVMPMQAYARPFDAADPRPRVAIIVAGIGLSDADSRRAIETLPPGVDLAMSAYAANPAALAQFAREHGHELLLSLPMEPQGYPLNEEGPHALLTGASAVDNAKNLTWTLERFAGYAGVTNVSDTMLGERFSGMAEPFGLVTRALAERGLLFVDGRAGAPTLTGIAGQTADLVLDDPPARADIEARLASLERSARANGSALAVAGLPRPVLLEAIVSWARGLESRGVVLAPVSAVSHPAAP